MEGAKLDSIRRAALDTAGPQAEAALVSLHETMRRDGTDRDGPIREVLALVGDRWTALILGVLGIARWRHALLRRIIAALSEEGAISQRVMTLKLRALERDGFVKRVATDDVPPRVHYELTPLGQSLVREVERQVEWVRINRPAIEAARHRFAAEQTER